MRQSVKKTLSAIQKDPNIRNYATMSGKSKLNQEEINKFSEKEKTRVINNHAQCITDFNIIYENKKDIKLYQIGSLHTKTVEGSHLLSENENYRAQKASQHIQFFDKPILITDKIHVVQKSSEYFQKSDIKAQLEENPHFKIMKENLIKELNKSNIPHRMAETPEDYMQTGYPVLLGERMEEKNNNYMFVLNYGNTENE